MISIAELQKGLDDKGKDSLLEIVDRIDKISVDGFERLLNNENLDLKNKDLKGLMDETVSFLKANETVVESEELLDYFVSKWPNDGFWEVFKTTLKDKMQPFEETRFIRQFSFVIQKLFFDELMENQFLNLDEEEDSMKRLKALEIDVSEDDFDIGVKVLYLMETMIIGNRVTKKLFINTTKNIFGFDEEISVCLWDQFYRNRNDFFEHYLVRNLRTIDRILSDIEKIED